mgnify:CR=1 FL=1
MTPHEKLTDNNQDHKPPYNQVVDDLLKKRMGGDQHNDPPRISRIKKVFIPFALHTPPSVGRDKGTKIILFDLQAENPQNGQ